jgi:mycofactocin precursor
VSEPQAQLYAEPEPETETEVTPASADPTWELIEDDLLVEEVSIDGMCGVY